MRITGGSLGGRALKGPSGQAIRPTSDRMRQSVFNILDHGLDFPVVGKRVLDLFAGTGANSFEALSRGAQSAVLVDIGAQARGLQRENIEALGLGGVTRILRRDATKLGALTPFDAFDLVFCDPPYGKGLGEAALHSALQGGWLATGALCVLEEAAGVEVRLPAGLRVRDQRSAGATQLIFVAVE